MTQALYRKWRPQVWNQVIGQEHITTTLQNAIRSDRVGHAYLFAGPRGTGKTTTARVLAKAVNCLNPDLQARPCDSCDHCKAVNQSRFLDLIEIDAASNTSVDDVRDLRDKINFSPSQGRFKVYIIDEVHMLSTAAFNALLKTLEEPPAHAIFILATTEVHKIPATVLSRCQRHEFRRIPVSEIVGHLSDLCSKEALAVDHNALQLIARQATGSMRDAVSLLDQLTSTKEKVTLDKAQLILGTATSQNVVDLVEAILTRQTQAGLDCIFKTLDGGSDPRQFAKQIVEYLRNLLLIQMNNQDQVEATPEMRTQMAAHASRLPQSGLLDLIRSFNQAAVETKSGWQPGLQLELAFAGSVSDPQALPAPTAEPAAPAAPARAPAVVKKPPAVVEEKAEPAKPEKPQPKPTPGPARAEPPQVQSTPNSLEVPSGELTLEEIRQHWKHARSLVKQHSMSAEALLNSSRPLGIKNGALILGFATEVLKSKMENTDNCELVCRVLTEAVGKPVKLICMVNSKTTLDMDTLEVDSNGMVSAALNLGGKIVRKE